MASILKVDTITGVSTAGSIAVTGEGNSTTTNLQQGLAKAWISYNMNSSSSIYDSLNFASLTDNGTGDATVTATNNLSNANFAQVDGTGDEGSQFNNSRALATATSGRKSTAGTRFDTGGESVNAAYDFIENDILIHGDLA
jgi:hypothetical protein